MSDKQLELHINSQHADKTPTIATLGGTIMLTPPVGEDYWIYRVPVSDKQAIVGFRKFGVTGIGFQHEEDWNTNLPSSSSAEDIYNHIKHNRLGADKKTCIAAIRLIQSAVELEGKP